MTSSPAMQLPAASTPPEELGTGITYTPARPLLPRSKVLIADMKVIGYDLLVVFLPPSI